MAVSFAAAAKAEICRTVPNRNCCALAECFGILLFCNSFTSDGIKIVTESRDFAWQLPRLFRKAFNVEFDSYPSLEAPGKLTFLIYDPEKIAAIMASFGFGMRDTLALHINMPIVEEECCKAAFLRGAFLSGGSVTDPAKGYHLEVTTTHQSVAKEAYLLMGEVMGFYPKTAHRGGSQVLYLKQSEQISDYLAYLSAPVAAMGIMEARLEKELNNKVNRRVNCDGANISKVVDAAQAQLTAIRTLRDRGVFEELPEKLRLAALAREENPESSLTELAQMMEPPITKPAMNNRMKKLMKLAGEGSV